MFPVFVSLFKRQVPEQNKMASNGLLLFTSTRYAVTSNCIKHNLQHAAKKLTAGVLYVYQWLPSQSGGPASRAKTEDISTQISRFSLVSSRVYCAAQTLCPHLDIRCLYEKSINNGSNRPSVPVDLVMVERNTGHTVGTNVITPHVVRKFVSQNFRVANSFEVEFVNDPSKEKVPSEIPPAPSARLFGVVGVGGTFDRIHNAHKVLLTEAVIRCEKDLNLAVVHDKMTKNKTLGELIEPFETRKEKAVAFCKDLVPHLQISVLPLTDAIGSTATDHFDLLVASAETSAGLELINKMRKDNGLNPAELLTINVLDDQSKMNDMEEDKISSSSQRIRLLGSRLKPPLKSPSLPYIIGITGGTCCGKTTISAFMETLGVPSINSDSMDHETYKNGSKCFDKVVNAFGKDVVSSSGDSIDRKALGKKVYASKQAMNKLHAIVWPEIKQLVLEQINYHTKQGAKAIILDASFLLEAKWDDLCHDIWVITIPNEEAIKRVQSRDKVSKEVAVRKVGSQVSSQKRIQRATFVFSTMWDEKFTKSQVKKAWSIIESSILRL
ncbi:unnamed protein product [Orchesella dallaii]|uniref:Cytidyltransferase-like domain-containing protein n=1 Tax=Orchesella dallaii TaxID=48710 RepID=A0ABP1PX58_9HEXA